jgi:hypothetical protein
MRAAPLMVCLWPGLAALWLRGRWSALATAVAFAALLNFALAGSLLWPDQLGVVGSSGVWLAVAALWLAGLWRNFRQLPELLIPAGPPAPAEDLFPAAQAEYLKGHWFEAEALLARQLQSSPEDAECRLLLATLLRRTGRTQEAQRQLRRLAQCDAAGKWRLEIEQEAAFLAQQAEHQLETLDGETRGVKNQLEDAHRQARAA